MLGRGGVIGNSWKRVAAALFNSPAGITQILRQRPRRFLLLTSLATVGLVLAASTLIYWKASSALKSAQQELATEREHAFVVLRLEPPAGNLFTWISAPAAFSGVAVFQGRLFVCGSAGLFEYDQSGKLLKHYRTGQELPPSPLLRITSGLLADATDSELLMVTASEGMLAFNGRSFRQIRPTDAEDRGITAILPLRSRQLLIGTSKRGVLVYDGKSLRQFHPALAGFHVTELAGTATDLWVGTMDQGVIHWSAGRAEKFSESQGMPDKQVFSIVVKDDKAYVGTALGVAEFEGGRLKRTLAAGAFARTLFIDGSTLLIGGLESGISEVKLEGERSGRPRPASASASLGAGSIQQITATGDLLLAVTAANVYSSKTHADAGWRPLLPADTGLLSDRNISSLALDDSGRLWVGYFDHGLELLDRSLKTVTHIEDEHVYCVNRILTGSTGADAKGIAVATANGLVLFDRSGKQLQVLGRAQGLIADHVTDVAPYGRGLVLATPAGLIFLDRGGPRSLYAFHGLVNNHVYSVGASGEEVVAGTLGGISLLEGERVVSNFTVSTPGLRHNWISAVVRTGDDWMIGTYGGGIVRLSRTGRFEDFEVGSGSFEVYPNSMVATGNHVLAGTLDHGLYSFNRTTNRWSVITEGLPSKTITALAAGDGNIYVGTDNGLVSISERSLP
jgi:ligand-binding sensor domain-containing protein